MEGKQLKGDALFVSFFLYCINIYLNTKEINKFSVQNHLLPQSNIYSMECNLFSATIYILDQKCLIENIVFSTKNLLSIEPKHSGIIFIKLNSQNTPHKLPNLENEIPPFQEFIIEQMKKFYLKYLIYLNTINY